MWKPSLLSLSLIKDNLQGRTLARMLIIGEGLVALYASCYYLTFKYCKLEQITPRNCILISPMLGSQLAEL